jgi:hypothetical protein
MWTWDEGAPKRHRRLFFAVPEASRVEVGPTIRPLIDPRRRAVLFPEPLEPRPSRFDLELFELREPFTAAELQRAYRLLARDAHPDRGGDAEEFVGITNARDRLLPFAR